MFRANSDKNLSLRPGNLDYFQSHFMGKKLPDSWSFKDIEIDGKSYPVRDFVGWMLQAPVFSERAKECLYPLISPHVQFLYMATIKKKKLYAVNVLQLEDCLDLDKSEITYSSDNSKRIIDITKVIFDNSKVPTSPIFKLLQDPGQVFVNDDFVKLVIDNKLKGAHFVDPADDLWYLKKPNECGIVT